MAGPAPGAHSRVGVDVGGTFTDVVLIDDAGAIRTWKLPSTPDDFSRGVIDGVTAVLSEHGVSPAAVRDVVHGSTVATNAILERRGARTGLLTTEGFRDVLELRRLRMPRLYDMTWQKPPPVVERRLRREVPERVGVDGAVVRPLDVVATRREAQMLVDEGVEAIAVSLLHAYANPSHERAIGDLLEREFPGLWVSLSHRVLPIIREYERTSTTVLNAYVQPTVASYLGALRRQLDGAKVTGPLLIMQSNGGIMAVGCGGRATRLHRRIGAGRRRDRGRPSSRAASGIDSVITFDMGGTTAKASLVEGGRPHFTAEFEVAAGISASSRLSSGGGYALSVPFIDLAEVGAGGGSLVWLDPAGAPKVGPRSAGADPGPVCYGRGGDRPTVTDANLLLGYLNPAGLLDGAMPLDVDRAREAFERDVAEPLGLDVLAAAHGAHELANASMIRAIKAVSVQRGRDPRDFTLVAFGGSGPIHAGSLARELGIRRVLVPPRPGVFSAVGLLQARLEFHAKKTYLRRLRDLSLNELRAEIAALEAEARAGLGPDALGAGAGAFEFERFVEMRYVGQGFELPVALPDLEGADEPAELGTRLTAAFDAEHERTYGHRTGNEAEIVHLRVVLREADPPPFPEARVAATPSAGDRDACRPLRGALRDTRDAGPPSRRRRPRGRGRAVRHRGLRRNDSRPARLHPPSGRRRQPVDRGRHVSTPTAARTAGSGGAAAIRRELIREALAAICEEMAVSVIRTSHSETVKSAMDFSTALCDATGEIIAQGVTLPNQLGALPDAVAAVLREFGGRLEPGRRRAWSTTRSRAACTCRTSSWSSPCSAATGCSRSSRPSPITRTSAASCRARCRPTPRSASRRACGSRRSGSTAAASRSTGSSRCCAPTTRVPEIVLGDLSAQIVACDTGERGLLALDRALRRARVRCADRGAARLHRGADPRRDPHLPRGHVPLHRLPRRRRRASRPGADLGRRHDRRRRRPAGLRGLRAAAASRRSTPRCRSRSPTRTPRMRTLLRTDIPDNAGFFRPITVTAPLGSLVNCVLPGGHRDSRPDRLPRPRRDLRRAGARAPRPGDGRVGRRALAGRRSAAGARAATASRWSSCVSGAWGGQAEREGQDGVPNLGANVSNIPIEMLEAAVPVRVDRYGFVAGHRRGRRTPRWALAGADVHVPRRRDPVGALGPGDDPAVRDRRRG